MSGTLAIIRELASRDAVHLSAHALDRLERGGILSSVVVKGLQEAVVVEDYPDATRGPTVLVLFKYREQRPLHAVWGLTTFMPDIAVLVTAYRPDPAQWSHDFLRRL